MEVDLFLDTEYRDIQALQERFYNNDYNYKVNILNN